MSELSRLTSAYEAELVIVHLQSEIIDDLFQIAAQHLSAEELDHLPVMHKIQEAAEIRRKTNVQ